MKQSKTSIFSNGLIWFGAAVSIAEILTGTFIAPLGFGKGLAAILLGHLIGCILLYLAGLIGAVTEKSAMDTVKMSYGSRGAVLFSSLNVLQLVGWTAVMIIGGAAAANQIVQMGGVWIWCIAITVLIIIWIMAGAKILDKLNIVAMVTLFLLTILLSTVIFQGNSTQILEEGISFGAAVELSVAMPLSWLPLISDYTRNAKKPKAASFASAVVYGITSSWMYVIGLGAAIFTGESDIAKILTGAGFGIVALIIVIFSTVTTTYLDAYSAGISSESISGKLKGKPTAIAVAILGMLLAIFTPIMQFENFLYLIGSVFAPMIAILITDYFILHKDVSNKNFSWNNLVLWFVGFVIYRIFMTIDTPIGSTVPVMIITSLICIMINKILGGKSHV